MNLERTILACLLALAVAMLPTGSGGGVNLASHHPPDISVADATSDCCPHQANPCDKAMDDCAAMATCALKCFSFAGASVVIVFPSTFAKMSVSFAGIAFLSQTASPPFRPPRG